MKVLLINGSPQRKGGTCNALSLVEKSLHEKGFSEDVCNDLIGAILKVDGIIIGSPVYFAVPGGASCALLDRVFYAASTHGGLFKGKPAAAVASCIRSGANTRLNALTSISHSANAHGQ